MGTKISILVLLGLLISSTVYCQKGNLVLSFNAKDAITNEPVSLQSVYVENLSESCDTSIYGASPYLYLTWPSGIYDNLSQYSEPFALEPNYPNPFSGKTKFKIYIRNSETIQIRLSNVYGATIAVLEKNLDHGLHVFEIETQHDNLHYLFVSNGKINKSLKLVSIVNNNSYQGIKYIGEESIPSYHGVIKSSGFVFHLGDQLLFRATATGYYNNTIFDSPTANTEYTFELQAQTTTTIPTVVTSPITYIMQHIANGGGNVTDDGGAAVTSRGICWSIFPNPTIADDHTTDGNGTGAFISYLSGLTENTTYHVRAYATNSVGTAYGTQLSFSTLSMGVPCPGNPTVTDADGNIYNTVLIGSQCWMKENLNVGARINGEQAMQNNSVIEKYCYNDNESNCETYGALYQWDEVMQYITTPGSQGICPIGWHVPNNDDWNQIKTLFPEKIDWMVDGSSGLNALLAGQISLFSTFERLGESCLFWSSDEYNSGNAISYYFHYPDPLMSGITVSEIGKIMGVSVRCIKNESLLNPPSITSNPIIDVTENTATGGGNVTDDGGATVIARGVCWSTGQNPTTADYHTADGSGMWTFVSYLTGLVNNTTYYVRAYATNSQGTSYGSQISFITGQSVTTPSVNTSPISNITQNSATGGGNVTSDGGATVSVRGVCWSTSPNPTTADYKTTDGSGLGTFVSYLSGLANNTTYYVRAYATNSVGTAYGNQITFNTAQNITIPTVTTSSVSSITDNSAISGGYVSDDGGASVTSRGVCWSISSNPTISDYYTTDGVGLGVFISYITGLNANTTYYVRAYATNSAGISYGNQISFTTKTTPTVVTAPITAITQTSATSGGNVTSDGGETVTDRGVCWSTSSNPTLSDNYTIDGAGIGSFISYLTGLTENTTYYVRAYATNSIGTGYGNEVSFSTLFQPWECGDTIDYSAQIYNTVLIGTQCWMKENLNVGIRIDGSQAMSNNSIIEKYCYDDLQANCDIYGGLYQWDEMMQYTTAPGVKGICPNGWHLPTDEEWCTLENEVDVGTVSCTATGWRGIDAGLNLKSVSGWHSGGNGVDLYDFTALPSGFRRPNSNFDCLTENTNFWSSTETDSNTAWDRGLRFLMSWSWRYNLDKNSGYSVRCIKN